MKKILLYLTILFVALTFIGAAYVLFTKGEANAGYAVVPMVFALSTHLAYRRIGD